MVVVRFGVLYKIPFSLLGLDLLDYNPHRNALDCNPHRRASVRGSLKDQYRKAIYLNEQNFTPEGIKSIEQCRTPFAVSEFTEVP